MWFVALALGAVLLSFAFRGVRDLLAKGLAHQSIAVAGIRDASDEKSILSLRPYLVQLPGSDAQIWLAKDQASALPPPTGSMM